MGKHYPKEFKEKIVNEYISGECGGYYNIAKKYNLPHSTVWNWIIKNKNQGNQQNDIKCKRGRPKYIDYKERYEILKKYQAFIKAQREKK